MVFPRRKGQTAFMCGIAGFVNDMPIDTKCPVLKRMTDIIAHRGPDSEGHYIDEHAALRQAADL